MALKLMYRSRKKGQKSYKIKWAGEEKIPYDPKHMLIFRGGDSGILYH